jgi:TPR repeat protein
LHQNRPKLERAIKQVKERQERQGHEINAIKIALKGILTKHELGSLQKAADAGNATAMKDLGWLYANGQGVARDYDKAREWYQKAADAGSAHTKAALAHLRQK